MYRWLGLDQVPDDARPSVITLGNFDGVHRGHVAVLHGVVTEARARNAIALAVTFDPHPLQVLYPDRAPASITSLGQRLDLMAATGLDAVLVQRFTPELALWSPQQYVETVFVDALAARAVVIGRDVRFGHRNSGDITTLRERGAEHGFAVVTLDDLGADRTATGEERRWSSTWIREMLGIGDVASAAQALGRWHAVRGEVVHGEARGRELGYPTANLGWAGLEGLVPADGVYAGQLSEEGGPPLPVAVSIGTNPQFGELQRRVEAHVIDQSGLDLYGHTVTVEFTERLRPMAVFNGVPELLAQMAQDVDRARASLRREA